MDKFKVTPWEVEGRIDYNKLIKDFGTKPITQDILRVLEKHGRLHVMLRGGYFFSHRDLDLALDDYEKGKGFFLYTGRAPSGAMHIGHLLPFIITKWFQDVFHANVYVQIPDEEKFLAKRGLSLEEIDKMVETDILHISSLGFDPHRTFIFRDREYIRHMYTPAVKVAKKITYSTARAVFGFTNETNIGIGFYPALQIVPTLFEKKRCLIPAAIDQDPYWRIQRDIAESLGHYKAAAIHSKFLPPLTGPEGKMSSSVQETAIYLDDDPRTVKEKIMKYAFSGGGATIEEHRKRGGNPEVDVAFQWLHMLFEEDDGRMEEIRKDYRSGKLLTGELKMMLIEKLNRFLEKHQKEKRRAEKLVRLYMHDGKLAKRMWEG
ncbi:MAG: tryptophan--tRNA ligase [Candidatus Aenigmarchaeota archaeon]|nr:tryptophan--tRNA ligase [Candidatus Aenigmarchaeota archaeon]